MRLCDSNGFVTTASHPALSARSGSNGSKVPVRRTTGMVRYSGCDFTYSQTSYPFFSGMMMSERMMSGRISASFWIAFAPLLTATTSKSPSENVSSTTFWMVILSSARRILFGIDFCSDCFEQRTTASANPQERYVTDRFLVFGHRGSPRRFPENTVASFEEALRCGAGGFETVLRLLSDKTAILFHDDEWQDAEIETLAADWMPTAGYDIARVRDLAHFANRATMVLEVKRAKWEDILLSEIAELPNIIVASFDHSMVAELARRKVTFPLGVTIFGRMVGGADYVKRL